MMMTSTRSSARSAFGRITSASWWDVKPRVMAQPNASRVARVGLGTDARAAAPATVGSRDSV